jgi:RNA polymerase sigma-70 factor (ECF subfamily)
MNLTAKDYNGVAPKTLKVAMHMAAKGDGRAFETIFNAFYEKLVLLYINKRKLTTSVAEDLASEVLSKVWEKAPMYNPKNSNVSTWVHTIASNHYIDYRRKEQRKEFYFPMYKILFSDRKADMPAFKVHSHEPTPEQTVIMDELKDFISYLLSSKVLKEKYATLIKLKYIEGMSFEEIAVEMGVKVNSTMRTNLARAKKSVKDYISDNFSLASQHAIIPTLSDF